MAKVIIEEKVDSAEKLATIAGKPSENYLLAQEFNAVKDLANVNGVKATSWETGTVYTEPTCVIKDNLLYVLNEAVTFPFTSTDFNAERTAGNWVSVTAVLPDLPVFEITTPANGEILLYDSTSSKWKNTSGVSSKKQYNYNTATFGVYNFGGSGFYVFATQFGMAAYGSARNNSGISSLTTFITQQGADAGANIIGGIAPFDMRIKQNLSLVTKNTGFVGGNLRLGIGYYNYDLVNRVFSNITEVLEKDYIPAANGNIDLKDDITGLITIPKGAFWVFSWATTKVGSLSGVYIQTNLIFEEV